MTTPLLIYAVPVRAGADITLWDELSLFPIDTARLLFYQPSITTVATGRVLAICNHKGLFLCTIRERHPPDNITINVGVFGY